MESYHFESAEIPTHLQEALGKALHAISVFVHDHAGRNNVVINVNHNSDAMNKAGGTMVSIHAMGEGITRAPDDDPRVIASKMLKSILDGRKDKKEEDK